MNPAPAHDAAAVVRRGGVVAYPTESCYGLGCDPRNPAAIERILRMKNRPRDKGLIVIGDCIERVLEYVRGLPDAFRDEILASWPGPFTWLLPAADGVSEWLRGVHDTIAVRVTAHDDAGLLCRLSETALVSTSANRAGQAPLTSAAAVAAEFADGIDCIMQGEIGGDDAPSTIRSGLDGAVIRA